MPLTIRDHLASIYCMLILGIDLPTAFSAHDVHGFYFILFFKILRISVLFFFSLFESVKIGRHNFSFYCVLALAGYFPFVSHLFFNGPSPQSTASGKLFFTLSFSSFNILVPVHMFLCVSFYHSFFSFVPGNLVGWKIWVCTEICFISFNCDFSYHFCIKKFPGLATTT